MTFSDKIRVLRTQKGLKQKDVAAMIGVSDRVYSYFEDGRFPKEPEVLTKLAQALDTTVSYLVGSRTEGPDIPPEFILMARKTGNLSEEHRQKVYHMLNETIDQVLSLLDTDEAGR